MPPPTLDARALMRPLRDLDPTNEPETTKQLGREAADAIETLSQEIARKDAALDEILSWAEASRDDDGQVLDNIRLEARTARNPPYREKLLELAERCEAVAAQMRERSYDFSWGREGRRIFAEDAASLSAISRALASQETSHGK